MNSIINRISTYTLVAVATAGLTVGLSGGGIIHAQGNNASAPNQMMTANVSQLNDTGASGTTRVQLLDDNQIKVTVNLTGTSPNLPHAQHFHIGGEIHACPDPSADTDDDGFISSVEGVPSYGAVKVSLTTEGDTTADSSLAVDRFPVADADGNVNYERTFTLPEGVSEADLTDAVFVQHGISDLFEDKAKYDGDKKSTLDEELPFEATVPASCGKLVSAPVGGAGTGAGSTAETVNVPMIAAGSAVLIGAGALLVGTRKVKS